jgi:hypothetical protein
VRRVAARRNRRARPYYVVAALSNQGPVQAPAFSAFVDLRLTE